MPFLPLRLVFGWLLLVGPLRGWSQGVLHPVNTGYPGPPLADLAARATAIFEGKAVAYRSFWTKDRSAIYTVATVAVYKVFKGPVAGTVEVATFGGAMPDGAMGLAVGGVPIGNNATGIFFALPFHDNAYTPAVPAGQVYQVVFGQEGFFKYNGLPPQPNAADTPWLRYAPVETALYPLLTDYTGTAYRVLRPFDVRTYDFIQERRRGIPPSPSRPAVPPVRKKGLSRP